VRLTIFDLRRRWQTKRVPPISVACVQEVLPELIRRDIRQKVIAIPEFN